MLEEEDEIAEEKSPLDGAWYKRTQNLSGKKKNVVYPGMSTGRQMVIQPRRAEMYCFLLLTVFHLIDPKSVDLFEVTVRLLVETNFGEI